MPILKIATYLLKLIIAGLQREAAAADRRADKYDNRITDSLKEEAAVIERIEEQYQEQRADFRAERDKADRGADQAHRIVRELGKLV